MATEASINTMLAAVNDQITALLAGAPYDHEEGEIKNTKSKMLENLFKARADLTKELNSSATVAVKTQRIEMTRMGTDISEYVRNT